MSLGKKTTSSSAGAQARRAAMKGLTKRRWWGIHERRAIRAFMRFDGYGYIKWHRKAKHEIVAAQRYEKRAWQLFRKAGVKLNP